MVKYLFQDFVLVKQKLASDSYPKLMKTKARKFSMKKLFLLDNNSRVSGQCDMIMFCLSLFSPARTFNKAEIQHCYKLPADENLTRCQLFGIKYGLV